PAAAKARAGGAAEEEGRSARSVRRRSGRRAGVRDQARRRPRVRVGAGPRGAGAGPLMATALDVRRRDAAAPADVPIAVEELRERGAISSLRDEWERVAAAMRAHGWTKGPFLAPEWFSVYAASLCNERDD